MSNRKTGRPVGRPKGAISAKRAKAMEVMAELERKLGRSVNPMEGLLTLGSDPAQPTDVRIQCMTECLPYLFPKLQSQTVALTGPNGDGPVEVATLDVGAIITQRPELASALTELSLMLSEQEGQADRPERGLPEPRLIDMPEYR